MATAHWRIDVWTREDFKDAAGDSVAAELAELGVRGVRSVRAIRGYQLTATLAEREVERAARELLADPVADRFRILAPGKTAPAIEGGHRFEIQRKPGVMDTAAGSVKRILKEMGIAAAKTATFRGYEIRGEASADAVRRTLERCVANGTIEDLFVDAPTLPFAADPPETRFVRRELPLIECNEDDLERMSKEMSLSLTRLEMRTIQEHFRKQKRNPTDAELETIAQTWSEHCKHKTLTGPVEYEGRKFQNLLKETIFAATEKIAAPWCLSVFKDNAGIVAFDEKWAVCFKVETHNHPSAIEPYGGAGTGIGGVIRDVLGCGLGAKPIASTDVFCVGPPDLPHEKVPQGALHPKRVLKGIVAGVRDYGNRMGIPTVNGAVHFHEDYVGNPLVYCGNVGLLPRDKCFKNAEKGDIILVVGGRTGRDGIHGATFSSVELHEESEIVSSTAVQIGDPITEKKVMEGVLRARDESLFTAITDCGAGGLSSAIGEMGEELGAEVDLEKVPLKYPGLTYAEIWISEAQERMVLAVPPAKLQRALALFAAEEVEATAIGIFPGHGRLVLRYRGQEVGNLDMEFLHDGVPKVGRKATKRARRNETLVGTASAKTNLPLGQLLQKILASPSVASKEWIIRRYDHEVQGGSVVKPLLGIREDGPGDAAVIAPIYGQKRGLAIGCGMNPRYGRLDPYRMAASAIDEAIRNVVCVGGDPARTAILDNFSWGNCDKPENLGDLVEAALACHDAAIAFGTPFISGKDSLNNEYRVGDRTIVIPPSLLISALAQVDEVSRAVTSDFKRSGSRLYLLGVTQRELGGSHAHLLAGIEGGEVPGVDLALAPKIVRALAGAIRQGLLLSCHDLSEGGLGVAAAEMAFAGEIGARLELGKIAQNGCTDDAFALLYSESNTRFLLEVDPKHERALETALAGLPGAWLGQTIAEPTLLAFDAKGKEILRESIEGLRQAWKGTLAW